MRMTKILQELTIHSKFGGAAHGYASMDYSAPPIEAKLYHDTSFTMSGVVELKPFKQFGDQITLKLSQDEINEIEEICRKSMLRQIKEVINDND